MIISHIKSNNFHYFNIHAEVSYYHSFEEKNNTVGIYANVFDNKVLVKLIEYLNELKLSNNELIILDFNHINNLDPNAHTEFYKLKTNKILFLNIKNDCIRKLILAENIHNFNRDKGYFNNNTYLKFSYDEDIFNKENVIEIEDYFFEFEKKLLFIIENNCLKEHKNNNSLHHSSSIYLPYYFDIKEILTVNKKFYILCMYYLSKKITTNFDDKNWYITNIDDQDSKAKHFKNITLFCQNLNSSFIASTIAKFILSDVMILDHIGPINRVYNEIEKKINHGEKYITVGDVICLGTEVRISKNIIEFSGGQFIGNISLIRIMTLENQHAFTNAFSLFEINKNLISKSPDSSKFKNFKIKTALD